MSRALSLTSSWLLMCLMLASCNVHEGVYLENHTKATLEIQAEFKTTYGQDRLKFTLKPNEYDAWEYEAPRREQSILDTNLVNISINNNEGCIRQLSREAVNAIAIKRGMWELHIDDKIMNCQNLAR